MIIIDPKDYNREANEITLNLACSESNEDWLRSARLLKNGSKKAKRKFDEMDAAQMVWEGEGQL